MTDSLKLRCWSLSSNPWMLWIWGASPEYRLPPPGCTPSSIDPTACIRIYSLQRFALEKESGYCYKNQGGVRWDLSPGPPPRIQQSSLEWFGMSSLWVLWRRIRGAVNTDSTLSTHNIPSFQVLGGQLVDDSSVMHSRFLIEWIPPLNGIGTLK